MGLSCVQGGGLRGDKPCITLQSMSYDKWLTVPDAAILVGVSPQAVRERIAANKIEADKRYGVIVVTRGGCEHWKAERKAGAQKILDG